ncbi:Ribokinase-like protein [Nadsonia fulvescens var. elongata DSM 6958]|uniref:pyridoxal kinase n=1 Tax=Nadsonia fulvescens var. elongata DSM 6958 TaxID=857566 RepID=A0A1E3PI50_9ASCO|nr:Ribokinase-like protein [Nadsonia fulvescens var. elongata DSM 6958]
MEEDKRILSIQSHVVHGYVGNRSATFPLQLQGWDVDAINTVQFSNHTGYGSVKGTKTTSEELSSIYEGIKQAKFPYDALLTGYAPGQDGVDTIGKICTDIRQNNPECSWTCDPVMGDHGRLYVDESVIGVYKKIVLSGYVTLITPNQFEAELLTGIKVDSWEKVKSVIDYFHKVCKIPNVVISSLSFKDTPRFIYSVGSSLVEGAENKVFYYKFPSIDSYFTGTGDLFAALLTDRFYTYSKTLTAADLPLKVSLGEVLSVMTKVLERTMVAVKKAGFTGGVVGDAKSMSAAELRVIKCKDLLGSNEQTHEVHYI